MTFPLQLMFCTRVIWGNMPIAKVKKKLGFIGTEEFQLKLCRDSHFCGLAPSMTFTYLWDGKFGHVVVLHYETSPICPHCSQKGSVIYTGVLCTWRFDGVQWRRPPASTTNLILTPISFHYLTKLVSCVFSALYCLSPGLSDCWRWEGMRSVKREASAFGLSLTGNDEKHMGYEKVQSNFLFTELPRNVNICHQVTPKRGTPCYRTPMAGPIPLPPARAGAEGCWQREREVIRHLVMAVLIDKGHQKRYPRLSAAVPPQARPAGPQRWGGRRGTHSLGWARLLPFSRRVPWRDPPSQARRSAAAAYRVPRTAPPLPPRRAERRGEARRPQPRSVVIPIHTTNFTGISHFMKIKCKDSCEWNRSLQNVLVKCSV